MDAIHSIIVPTDFSAPSRAATERAVVLAKAWDATLHLIHSARVPMPAVHHEFAIPGPEWETVRRAAEKQIDRVCGDLQARGVQVTKAVTRKSAVEAIVSAARDLRPDLVVMGSHGHTGLQHLMLGSVAERTLRAVEVPVMAVKEDEQRASEPIRNIVLATDFSPHAHSAAELAIVFARRFRARVDICHVHAVPRSALMSIEPPPPSDWLDALERSAGERVQKVLDQFRSAGVEAETHLVADTPSLAIPNLAEELEADLIVMGTRGLSGLRHVMLGSVAERTVRLASCSVLADPRPVSAD